MRPEHEEEYEVLQSIYEGDSNFTAVNNTTFQYKYEDPCDNKSFMIELEWEAEYPDIAPKVNLELFYNKHLVASVKERIEAGLKEQAQINLGMSMTFTLIEWLKEAKDDILQDQPIEAFSPNTDDDICDGTNSISLNGDYVKKKKDQMTKAQKRRMWDRQNASGERERGWNWIDVVKHLSQTGGSSIHTD